MMKLALVLFMLGLASAHADEVDGKKRYCTVSKTDNLVQGCYSLDPKIYPAPDGTFYVEDVNVEAGPGVPYDGKAFVHPPEIVDTTQRGPSLQEQVEDLQARLEALEDAK